MAALTCGARHEAEQVQAMVENLSQTTDRGQCVIYEIRLRSHLGYEWTDWFEGLTITLEDNGDMLLTGPVVDQAALHGLLKKVRNLGVPLVSLNPVPLPEAPTEKNETETNSDQEINK